MKTENEKLAKERGKKRKIRKEAYKKLKIKRDVLQKSNDDQGTRIKQLNEIIGELTKKKEEAEKKVKELEKEIKNLEGKHQEELMELKKNQPDPEELSQLRKEKTELSTKIEELGKRVNESELDRKRLQKMLNEYITCKRRKYKGTKLMVP